jgi:aminopeptidase-like protein
LNYSIPINKKSSLKELKEHLFTLPEHPDWIPYRTTYFEENWGFCLTQKQYAQLKDDLYEVVIDSTLKEGSLTYGELFLEGEIEDEVLFTCYVCHPSMCNDNLSGVSLLTFLAKYLSGIKRRYSYRFLFIPETIGAITWLCMNENRVSKIKHGLVATCLGDAGKSTYKKSRQGNAVIDRVAIHVLENSYTEYNIIDFFPNGSDERQFCSPAFNLPVGSLMRTRYGLFLEYHTSADNLEFVKKEYLYDSFVKYLDIIIILEQNKTYLNLNPKCEPQLGKRGLYSMIGAQKDGNENNEETAFFWVLNLSDGKHSLLDISERSGFKFEIIKKTADILHSNDLLKEII